MAKVVKSVVLTPNSRLAMTRVSSSAPAIPRTTPTPVSSMPCRSTISTMLPLRAERHPQADVVGALRDEVRHHAVDADDRQNQREHRERSEHHHRETLTRQRMAHPARHRLDVEDRHGGIGRLDRADHGGETAPGSRTSWAT